MTRRPRLVIFGLVIAAAVVAVAEIASLAALFFVEGKWFSPARARRKMEHVRRQCAERSNESALHHFSVAFEKTDAPEVVHPYFGYVRDPDEAGPDREIDGMGFFLQPPPDGQEPLRYTIGVFGGSVAHMFVSSAGQHFVDTLRSAPQFKDRQIWLRSFAMGGYKQPQQLMILNYLLAVGEPLDLVVNIDGFNDISLAQDDDSGLFPAYPRQWPRRMADLPDQGQQRLVGEISFLEHRRMGRTEWCSEFPLSVSPACHLIWKVVNRRSAARIDRLREALRQPDVIQRRFLTHGPETDRISIELLLPWLAQLWARGSVQMHAACEQQGIDYLHFLQPNQYVPESKRLNRQERMTAFDADSRWAHAVVRGYPELVRAADQITRSGVGFHDLRFLFSTVDGATYSDPCCHLTRQGNRLLAEKIAAEIILEVEGADG